MEPFRLRRKTWLNIQRYVQVCAKWYTNDPELIKDYTQDVLTEFLEKNVDITKLTKRYIHNAVRFATYRHYNKKGKQEFIYEHEFVSPSNDEESPLEILKRLAPKSTVKLHDKVISMLINGMSIVEISYRLNKTPEQIVAISKYGIKRIRNKMSVFTNPFTGKTEKGRSISQHSWEKLSDKEDYDFEDGNEFYEIYRHKESKELLLVKLPTAKTNSYIK